MTEPVWRVELTASFDARLDDIDLFLQQANASFAFDRLLQELSKIVIANLQRFPRMGRRYLTQPPQSTEALAQLSALPLGAPDALREYLHGDYLILYILSEPDQVVYLLSIRHHRELSFDFAKIWPSDTSKQKH